MQIKDESKSKQKNLWKKSGSSLSFKQWLSENGDKTLEEKESVDTSFDIKAVKNQQYPFMPVKSSEAERSFGFSNVYDKMPEWQVIDRGVLNKTKFVKFIEDWFFSGVNVLKALPKDGINKDEALGHIAGIMRSWQPKHEHKTYGCAYLMALWFDDIQWERRK
jgi:hypothetical protein